jgi:hypothetical protein
MKVTLAAKRGMAGRDRSLKIEGNTRERRMQVESRTE